MTLRPAPPDAEIGRTPHRDRSTSASRAVVVQCVVVSRMSRASPLWVGSTGARVCQGRSVDVAHSCALRVSRNPGIMRNSNVSSNHALISHVRSPPHRTWEPDHHTPRSPEKPIIPTKKSPTPQRPQPPMCNTKKTRHQTHHTPRRDRSGGLAIDHHHPESAEVARIRDKRSETTFTLPR